MGWRVYFRILHNQSTSLRKGSAILVPRIYKIRRYPPATETRVSPLSRERRDPTSRLGYYVLPPSK